MIQASVPDPDPPEQHVLGAPGSRSGSTSQMYRSGSGFFYYEEIFYLDFLLS
jgi:hypothetical protein